MLSLSPLRPDRTWHVQAMIQQLPESQESVKHGLTGLANIHAVPKSYAKASEPEHVPGKVRQGFLRPPHDLSAESWVEQESSSKATPRSMSGGMQQLAE